MRLRKSTRTRPMKVIRLCSNQLRVLGERRGTEAGQKVGRRDESQGEMEWGGGLREDISLGLSRFHTGYILEWNAQHKACALRKRVSIVTTLTLHHSFI